MSFPCSRSSSAAWILPPGTLARAVARAFFMLTLACLAGFVFARDWADADPTGATPRARNNTNASATFTDDMERSFLDEPSFEMGIRYYNGSSLLILILVRERIHGGQPPHALTGWDDHSQQESQRKATQMRVRVRVRQRG